MQLVVAAFKIERLAGRFLKILHRDTMAVLLGRKVEGEGQEKQKKGRMREFYHAKVLSQNKDSCRRTAGTL